MMSSNLPWDSMGLLSLMLNLGFGHAVVTHGWGALSLVEQVADDPGLVCPLRQRGLSRGGLKLTR
jgi:hypothetical protein